MEAVRKFLAYRSTNIQDYSKLSDILDQSFVMTLPITPYMAFNKTEVTNRLVLIPLLCRLTQYSQRVLVGINSYMADVASLAMMVETVGFASSAWIQALLMYDTPPTRSTHSPSS
jgi:hypothetical protein